MRKKLQELLKQVFADLQAAVGLRQFVWSLHPMVNGDSVAITDDPDDSRLILNFTNPRFGARCQKLPHFLHLGLSQDISPNFFSSRTHSKKGNMYAFRNFRVNWDDF